MYKLIIVEDEAYTADQIASSIDWDNFDIKMSGVFYNGKCALDYVLENPVDIVIADISMPHIDGFELIETIQKIYPNTKFIIITGHRNFEFSLRALKLGVIDYVLKPIQYETVTEAVKKAVSAIKYMNLVNHALFTDANIRKNRGNLFKELIDGQIADVKYFKSQLVNYEMDPNLTESDSYIVQINLSDSAISHWKHSVTGYKNAIIQQIPYEIENTYLLIIDISLTSLTIIALAKPNIELDKEHLIIYFNTIKTNIFDILKLEINYEISESSYPVNSYIAKEEDKKSSNVISRVHKYIIDHISETITLNDISEYVHFNPSYFSRYFKKNVHMNFSEYLNNTRLDYSKDLLKNTEMTTIEICEAIGIKSESYFFKQFKNKFGITPQQYRDENR